jgi:urea transporter
LITTGAWPLIDRRSFEAITGSKQEFWLARCIGGLSIAIGVALLRTPRVDLLCGSALTFIVADLHAGRNVSRAYFLDAILQATALAQEVSAALLDGDAARL